MLRSCLPAEVRRARPEDAQRLSEVFQESWLGAYTGMVPHEHLTKLIARRNSAWWTETARRDQRLIVVEIGGIIAGYANFGPSRSRGSKRGEIYEIYMAPDYQGLGLGEQLFEACRERLDRARFRGLVVWALAENHMALDFYWRRGGRPFAKANETMSGTKVPKIGYAWP